MKKFALSVFAFALSAAALVAPVTQAGAEDRSTWQMSGEAAAKRTAAQSVAAAEFWSCEGDAIEPLIVLDAQRVKYISYESKQTCVGAFVSQTTCAKLQKKTDLGGYEDRTLYSCSAQTAKGVAYVGRSVKCSSAGSGTFRTAGYGTAFPNGQKVTSATGYSQSRTLSC
ncbi:hypothetical protein [Intrasporangium sp. DVR]|uniref:hypothetical protein n=1 Tax=Intrasporangium sp. DVR TaxID=3127867 RepID=UPI00313A640F